MAELCCKFKIPASNTVGGAEETRTVLKSVTEICTDVPIYIQTDKGKTICLSPLRGMGIKILMQGDLKDHI